MSNRGAAQRAFRLFVAPFHYAVPSQICNKQNRTCCYIDKTQKQNMLQLAESVEELDGIGFTSKRHGHKALLLDVAADLGKACICLSRLLLVTVHRKFHPIKQIKTQTQLHTSF